MHALRSVNVWVIKKKPPPLLKTHFTSIASQP